MARPLEHWITRHRLTVAEYHRMGEVGVLAPDARCELIEGEIIDMSPIGSRHASAVDRLTRSLILAVGDRAIVRVQNPLTLDPDSEPEPDLAVVRNRRDRYRDAHPTAADVLLIVEVADLTARYDRTIKVPLYARHGVPEVWVIDMEERRIRYWRRPAADGYRESGCFDDPGATPVPGLPGVVVDLAGLV